MPPQQHLSLSQHLPPLGFDPTFLLTTAHEVERIWTIETTVTAGEPLSNTCVSTTCNGVNVNNVKPSVEPTTFVVKPVINSINFNGVVNVSSITESLYSKTYPSNDSKNEPF